MASGICLAYVPDGGNMFHSKRHQLRWYLAVSGAFCLGVLGWLPPVPRGTQKASKESALSSYKIRQHGNLPISFEPNRQQFDSRFQFMAHSAGKLVILKATT